MAEQSLSSAQNAAAEAALVDDLVARARKAQQSFARDADQSRFDMAALAAAWAIMEPARNAALSTQAVEQTGLGNVADKTIKNHRKTLGLLRDIQDVRTVGVIKEEPDKGLTEIARPIGVVGAVVPSTNPAATPANNVINALKCGNAIILSPSPKGVDVCAVLLKHIHAEFDKLGLDHDLVQMVPSPSSKIKTQRLMEAVDLIIVTGSQDNVRRAYESGTPALGVGAGNATVIVDETADLDEAAKKITASKTFDNATSCSSENGVIVVRSVLDDFLQALHAHGGRWLDESAAQAVKSSLFDQGHLNRYMIAKDIDVFLEVAGVQVADQSTAKFVILPGDAVGADAPESGEKLSLALTLYVVDDFEAAMQKTQQVLAFQGAGHSVGLHSRDDSRAVRLGLSMPTCRVIVNQAHCFATGGSFENGLPFSLSMGCGSWGGNSIDDNLHYRHFMNITRIVRPIPANEPSVDEVFKDYWAAAGR
ncbi:acylating sulfoacetaldehyde dehydrogenase [Granulosicoccus antarcticus]|uniref:Sulfoacetaldehyde dehydrogenase (Acylating) n=1 Tax=Granulosicoccus antarcticus IMCC3135 TaxID=1192854 RepID=A0A2Z2NY54_9GAMM|nr:aldehyde dehydrogenase family protein [Granulosicoccus antarcticus]ASJ74688.1 Sulfoacetaldehyde dehydrogenase (acylating) [Granulosicoccus antarcticus IMCC3135]